MATLKEVFSKNKSSLVVIAITGFVTSILYDYLKFDNNELVSVLLIIVLPIILIPIIYSYFFRKKNPENK